jgi:hypothetical protein
MKMVQKAKAGSRAREEEQEAPEVTLPDEQDLQESADETLADIECCLAENEEDAEKALRQQAKAEWDQLWFKTGSERAVQEAVWMAKYQHLFRFCCGSPVFDE